MPKPQKSQKNYTGVIGRLDYPRHDLLLVLLIYLISDLIFYRKILSPSVMVFGTDWLAAGYPIHEFIQESLRQSGQIPQWIPHLYGGVPLFANAGATYFPFTILLRSLFPVHQYFAYLYILNTLVGGFFTYLFLKNLKLTFWPAFIGGLGYMFTGILVSSVYGGHEGRMAIVAFLPAVMYLVHLALEKQTLVSFLLAGLGLGFSLLIPHVQMNYYLLIMVFFYFCFRLYGILRLSRNWPLVIKLSGYFLVFIAVGFMLSAVLYLPFYKYVPYSPRGGEEGRGYQFASSWSMPPEEAINLAVPDFSGTSVGEGTYWGRNAFKLHSEYLGATVILLFFAGLAFCRKNKQVLFFLIMIFLSFTVAWGASTPLFKLYYQIVPGFNKFRAPSLIFFLIAFSIMVISAFGLQSIIEQVKSEQNLKRVLRFLFIFLGIVIGVAFLVSIISGGLKSSLAGLVGDSPQKLAALQVNFPKFMAGMWKYALFTLFVALVLLAVIRQKLKLHWAGIILSLFTVIDLWLVESKYVQVVSPPEVYFAPDEVVQALRSDNSLFRILPLQYRNDNYPILFNLQSVSGEHGNQLQRYNEFLGAGKTSMVDYHNILNSSNNLNFLNLSNAKYLIVQNPTNFPGFKEVHRGRAFIYENLGVIPRVFMAPRFEVIPESEKILQRLGQADFNPLQTVILEKNPGAASAADSVHSTARIVEYQPMKVKVQAESDQPGFLVLLDNYYPDWKAYVDGQPTEIYRADYTFRAIQLDKGSHQVEFAFVPKDYQLGSKISLFSFLGLLVLWSGNFLRKKFRKVEKSVEPS